MTAPSPYSLTANHGNSDTYYHTIAAFADRWTATAETTAAKPVKYYLAFLEGRALVTRQEPPERGFSEAAFEMLVLGVLLREHGAQALRMPLAPAWMLAKLVATQDRLPLPAIEKPVKAMRGWMQGLLKGREPAGDFENLPMEEGAAGVVHRLVAWLRAEGLNAQADRMSDWRDFMARLDEQSAQAVLARCLLMADEFAVESEAALGIYTQNAGEFATCAQANARWRYDAELVTRTPVEYHLGMLGTEILSRAYRQRYLAAERKIVIVPACLCAHSLRSSSPEGGEAVKCQAVRTSLGGKCQGCTLSCKVRTLTQLGERRGFEVYILPDDLRGVGLGACSTLKSVGIVGISCALTNWDAGWQVNDAGVPAQGVLLDYPGCRSHWNECGIPTDLNLKKLLEVVGVTAPQMVKPFLTEPRDKQSTPDLSH